MQSGEASETDGQANPPSGDGNGGALTEAILSEPAAAPKPLFEGDALVLWTTAGAFLAIFFTVIFLIMRRDARTAIEKRRRRPPGDFFQPAGEGAEITFDDDDDALQTPPKAAAAKTASKPREISEESVEDDGMSPKRRVFGGFFGGRRRKQGSPASENLDASGEDALSSRRPPEPLRAHPLANERRNHSEATALDDTHGRNKSAPAQASGSLRSPSIEAERYGEDEAARARRQVEEEFRRIEEERRAAADKAGEFERRKQVATLEEERRAVEEREQALTAHAIALERQIDNLRRDLADELDARFDALARTFDDKLARALSERGPRDAPDTETSASLRELEDRVAILSQNLDQKTAGAANDEQVSAIANLVSRRISEQREAMDSILSALSKRIDALTLPSQEIQALRDEIAALKHAVPSAGAGAGAPTIQLSDLLRDALPPGAFEMRVLLANNRKADCLVRLPYPPGPIAIDAQFPVDAFHRLEIQGEQNAQRAESDFRRAALRHIADVAERLICPGETADSALMFIPSEGIYSTLHARFPDIIQDSHRAHVWIVSPTTLMAALHTMRAVMRDTRGSGGAVSSHADDNAVLSQISALSGRVSSLEKKLSDSPEESPSDMDVKSVASGGGVSGEPRFDTSGSDRPAQPQPRPEGRDRSEGDLWDDDQSQKGASSPFPLR